MCQHMQKRHNNEVQYDRLCKGRHVERLKFLCQNVGDGPVKLFFVENAGGQMGADRSGGSFMSAHAGQ